MIPLERRRAMGRVLKNFMIDIQTFDENLLKGENEKEKKTRANRVNR